MLRGLILMTALAAGGAAAWMSFSMLGNSAQPATEAGVPGIPTEDVLVAALPIKRGEALGPTNLGWQSWPETALTPGLILRETEPDALESYSGWIARGDLLDGEPIRLARLSDGTGGLMALMLTPGSRALAVRTSAESSAGGFILPNDRIDVLHTIMRDVDGDGQEEPVTLTLLRNVRVLAVDQITEQVDGTTAKVGDTVTLELSPGQAELLTSARNSGRLSLTLRAVSDFGETELADAALLAATQTSRWRPPEARAAAGDTETSPFLAMLGLGGEEATDAAQPDPVTPEPVPSAEADEPADTNPPPRAGPVRVRIVRSGQTETVVIEGEQSPGPDRATGGLER